MIPIIVASTIASKKNNYNRYEYDEHDKKCANKCTAGVIITFVIFIFIAALI